MAIDRKEVIKHLSRIRLKGNANGLIPAFGVFVNQLPAGFWCNFSERLTMAMDDELLPSAEFLLVNAGNECGYHTGHGIITSGEWKAVVEPMIRKVPEDVLHGLFAVITALGWARSEIVELVPGVKMVVRAYDYYESDVVQYGRSSRMSAYMLRGITSAFMDLAYGRPYPDGRGMFVSRQVKGLECGDDYGEFIVEKAES